MRNSDASHRIKAGFTQMLIVMMCCMGCVAGLSIYTLEAILSGQRSHAESFVPAKRLTASFEREVLNARIFFIYFVTIQKPGTLGKGWERYNNAQARLDELTRHVNQHDELSNLRAPVARLRADVDAYSPALASVLTMVQNGELRGPHYDAQVKEWAARGATMVTDAGNVETLCATSSEASTSKLVKTLKHAKVAILVMFLLSGGVCGTLAWVLRNKLSGPLHETLFGPGEATSKAAIEPSWQAASTR